MPVPLNIYNILNFNGKCLNLIFQLKDLIVKKLLQRTINLLKTWKNQVCIWIIICEMSVYYKPVIINFWYYPRL